MKRSFVGSFTLLVILGLILAACGQPGTDAGAPTPPAGESAPTPANGQQADAGNTASSEVVQLNFVGWGGPEEQRVFQQLVATFNQNNPDIFITYTPTPNEYVTKLNTMIAGGTPPDIAYIPDGDFSAFVTRGTLVNIQSLGA